MTRGRLAPRSFGVCATCGGVGTAFLDTGDGRVKMSFHDQPNGEQANACFQNGSVIRTPARVLTVVGHKLVHVESHGGSFNRGPATAKCECGWTLTRAHQTKTFMRHAHDAHIKSVAQQLANAGEGKQVIA